MEGLPGTVHATDYDVPDRIFRNVTFHRADVRSLPLPDNHFDRVLAVSVVEHIGLEASQVTDPNLPVIEHGGDGAAVRELARVLKPGGELVMTLPFGIREGLILGNEARNYTEESLRKFQTDLVLVNLEYYEYQHKDAYSRYEEYSRPLAERLSGRVKRLFWKKKELKVKNRHAHSTRWDLPGVVTWRRIPVSEAAAVHNGHLEGVVCGVWRKPLNEETSGYASPAR